MPVPITVAFYQSLRALPREEATALYRLPRWQRLTRLEVPAAVIPLVWNAMMSFGGGWFFLAASEAISVLNQSYTLPGVGSYVTTAVARQDLGPSLPMTARRTPTTASTDGALITATHVTKTFPLPEGHRVFTVLADISVEVRAGEVVALLGAAGARRARCCASWPALSPQYDADDGRLRLAEVGAPA